MKSKSIFLLAFLFCSSVVPVKSDSGGIFKTRSDDVEDCSVSKTVSITVAKSYVQVESSVKGFFRGITGVVDYNINLGPENTYSITLDLAGVRYYCIDTWWPTTCSPSNYSCVVSNTIMFQLLEYLMKELGAKGGLGSSGGGDLVEEQGPGADINYH